MSLFKYSERKWCELLTSKGSVRVGTLFDFRKAEHKEGISDPQEGKKSVYHQIDDYDSKRDFGIDRSAVENFGAIRASKEAHIMISGIGFERKFEADDCYVHCTSHFLGRGVMEQFEKADSCVEIFKQRAFYKRLTDVINKKTPVHFYGVRAIFYSNRREAFNGQNFGGRPDLIKETSFEGQCEMRAIWMPKSKKKLLLPFCFEDKSLIKCCREVGVP